MNKLNSKIIIAFIIHLLIIGVLSFDPKYSAITPFFLIFNLANLIGIILIAVDKPKIGAYIFFISSIVFVPIGLIGVMGARNVLDKLKKEKFSQQNS